MNTPNPPPNDDAAEAAQEASTALARIVLENVKPAIQRELSQLVLAVDRLTPEEKEIVLAALCDTSDAIHTGAKARDLEVHAEPLAFLAAIGRLVAAVHHADEEH